MNLDDHICYCYHVPMRKLINFAKRVEPKRPSQMTECLNVAAFYSRMNWRAYVGVCTGFK